MGPKILLSPYEVQCGWNHSQTLPLITRVGEMEGVGISLNSINKAKQPSTTHQNTLELQLA